MNICRKLKKNLAKCLCMKRYSYSNISNTASIIKITINITPICIAVSKNKNKKFLSCEIVEGTSVVDSINTIMVSSANLINIREIFTYCIFLRVLSYWLLERKRYI